MKPSDWIRKRKDAEAGKGLKAHVIQLGYYGMHVYEGSVDKLYLIPAKGKEVYGYYKKPEHQMALIASGAALVGLVRAVGIDYGMWAMLEPPMKSALFNAMVDKNDRSYWRFLTTPTHGGTTLGMETLKLLHATTSHRKILKESWLMQVISEHWMGKKDAGKWVLPEGKARRKWMPKVVYRTTSRYRDITVSNTSLEIGSTDILLTLGTPVAGSIRTGMHPDIKLRPAIHISYSNYGNRRLHIIPCMKVGESMYATVTHRKHWYIIRTDGTIANTERLIKEALDSINRNKPWTSLKRQAERLAVNKLYNMLQTFDGVQRKHKIFDLCSGMRDYMAYSDATVMDYVIAYGNAITNSLGRLQRFDVWRTMMPYIEDTKLLKEHDFKPIKFNSSFSDTSQTATYTTVG